MTCCGFARFHSLIALIPARVAPTWNPGAVLHPTITIRISYRQPEIIYLDSAFYVDYRRHMDASSTVKALGALSQISRLEAFRLLVRSGSTGMAAGEIARALEVPHNTMSSHLSVLVNAGLIGSRRESRSIIYSIDFAGTRDLLSFLMEDCCRGRPELCAPVLDSVLSGCCAASNSNGDKQ
jgi:DNA-binding transcriptional ArsR family regulator